MQIFEREARARGLTDDGQAHRGFGVVPRVDNAAVVPGDRTIVALQIKNARAGTIEMAFGDRVAIGEMRHAASFEK